MNLNQKKSDFEFENEDAKILLISFNTSINQKHINDNSRSKRAKRAFFVVAKKQKRNDDDTNDVFNDVDDFNTANEIEDDDNDDELAKSERDVNEASITLNDDEIARRETNDDEDFSHDAFRERDAFEKCKRT
jgi:hypothetical protein